MLDELRARWGLHAGLVGRARLWRQHGDRAHDVCVPPFHPVFWRDGAGVGASGAAGRQSPCLVRGSLARLVRGGRVPPAHSRWSTSLHADALYRRSLRGSRHLWGICCNRAWPGMRATTFPAMMKNAADVSGSLGHASVRARDRRASGPSPPGRFRMRYREAYILEATRFLSPSLPAGEGRRAARRTRVEGSCGLHPRVHTPRQLAEAPGTGAATAGETDLRAA